MHRPPTHRLTIWMLAALLLPLLVACGGDSDESSQTGNELAAVTAPPPQEASIPPIESTAVSTAPAKSNDSAGQTANPPVTLVPADSNASGDVPDNPWGKVIPTGPAPTVPPNPPSDFDSDGDGMYTNDELNAAIRALFPTYEWPANYQTTADRIIDGMNQEAHPNSMSEAPAEFTIIGMYHQCAWQYALRDAAHENDQALIDESRHQLVDIGQKKNPLSRDENGKAFMRTAYDKAALGDTAPLQQIVDADCQQRKKFFITPGSSTPTASNFAIPKRSFVMSFNPPEEG